MTNIITLRNIAGFMRGAGMRAHVESLGGNVAGIITDDEVTLTINGGQVSNLARDARGIDPLPTELLICRDGAELLRTEIQTAIEVVPLVAAATAPRWSNEPDELTALRATETPTERAILANFLLAAGWADARDAEGEQVTTSIDPDDITAADATWVAVRKMIRAFLAELTTFSPSTADAVVRGEAARIVQDNPEQAGHDLWLTMRHHGAGFWDRGYGPAGDLLTEIAERLGSEDAHVEVDIPADDFAALAPSDPLPTITLYYPS